MKKPFSISPRATGNAGTFPRFERPADRGGDGAALEALDAERAAHADTRQIAAELLEALKKLRADWTTTDHGDCDCQLCQADAAIAKAEGTGEGGVRG